MDTEQNSAPEMTPEEIERRVRKRLELLAVELAEKESVAREAVLEARRIRAAYESLRQYVTLTYDRPDDPSIISESALAPKEET